MSIVQTSTLPTAPERIRAPHPFFPQLPYRSDTVYGPIHSRRLGNSLGINLLPTRRKVCNYDCKYCQFPRTPAGQDWRAEGEQLLRGRDLLDEIEIGIRARLDAGRHFESITLSGNGDPSVHPELEAVARHLRALIKRWQLACRLSIFTNAMRFDEPDFLRALEHFDERFIKLDAGDDDTLRLVDQPRREVSLGAFVEALAQVRGGVTFQTMLVAGEVSNVRSVASASFAALVRRAGARAVQLYTIDKRPAYRGVLPLTKEALDAVAAELRARMPEIPVAVFHEPTPSGFEDAAVTCGGATCA